MRSVSSSLKQIKQALKAYDYQRSLVLSLKALRDFPQHGELRFCAGKSASALGMYDLALSHLSFALSIDPFNLERIRSYLQALCQLHLYEELITYLQRYASGQIHSAELSFMEGYAREKLGDLAQSRACYKEAFTADPKHERALAAYGKICLKMNNLNSAKIALKQACQLNPSRAEYLYLYGRSLSLSGQTKEALKSYKKALRYRPHYHAVHFELGMHWESRKTKRAIKHYQSAIMHSSSECIYQAYERLGHLKLKQGRHSEALEYFRVYLTYASNDERQSIINIYQRLLKLSS